MTRFAPLLACIALTACADETISGYADRTATYHLVEFDGRPAEASATIGFPAPGRVAGRGPCNSFSAGQTAPYPWFDLGPLVATEAACPALDAESAFFQSLTEMTFAEVSGPALLLSNDAGRSLLFMAR